MASKTEIMAELKSLGSEQTKRTLVRHGAVEPIYGVKIEDLKKIQKRIKRDHKLALELYKTGCSDAMYLASLISEPDKFTKAELQAWAETASWQMITEYSVAWAAAESPHGWELARQWIASPQPHIASAGWATLTALVGVTPDDQLEIPALKKLLQGIPKALKAGVADRVAYTMNGFVIAIASYVAPLTDSAMAVAQKIGKVDVDMGDTACNIPLATSAIQKVIDMGRVGKKRKTAYC